MKMNKKILSGILAAVMVVSMTVPAFATELTAADIAGADTENGTYNVTDTSVTGDDGKASTVVVIDAEATTFKATVPIALHVAQDALGNKTYADDMSATGTGAAKIINECGLGQVKIADVKVVAETNYEIKGWNEEYANMKVNSKVFGFKINGLEVNTDGTLKDFAVATDSVKSEVVASPSATTDLARVYNDYTFTYSAETPSAFPLIANGSVLPITYEAKLPAYSAAVADAQIGAVVFTIDFN